MLITDNAQAQLQAMRDEADKIGPEARAALEQRLVYLGEYAKHDGDDFTQCELWPDVYPTCIGFVMKKRQQDGSYAPWFNGVICHHGEGTYGVHT